MMENLTWTPLAERRREQRLILLFKIVNDLVAIPTDDITFNNRPSRNSNNRQIQVLSTNTDIYKNFVLIHLKRYTSENLLFVSLHMVLLKQIKIITLPDISFFQFMAGYKCMKTVE
jgi:hypothetical protein